MLLYFGMCGACVIFAYMCVRARVFLCTAAAAAFLHAYAHLSNMKALQLKYSITLRDDDAVVARKSRRPNLELA